MQATNRRITRVAMPYASVEEAAFLAFRASGGNNCSAAHYGEEPEIRSIATTSAAAGRYRAATSAASGSILRTSGGGEHRRVRRMRRTSPIVWALKPSHRNRPPIAAVLAGASPRGSPRRSRRRRAALPAVPAPRPRPPVAPQWCLRLRAPARTYDDSCVRSVTEPRSERRHHFQTTRAAGHAGSRPDARADRLKFLVRRSQQALAFACALGGQQRDRRSDALPDTPRDARSQPDCDGRTATVVRERHRAPSEVAVQHQDVHAALRKASTFGGNPPARRRRLKARPVRRRSCRRFR
jgi:hypothetical protein